MKKAMKGGSSFEEAAMTGLRLLALDRALSDLVVNSNCLSLPAKGQLARMQRGLRKMRIQVEVEGRLPALAGSWVLPLERPHAGNSHPDHVNLLNIAQSLNKQRLNVKRDTKPGPSEC